MRIIMGLHVTSGIPSESRRHTVSDAVLTGRSTAGRGREIAREHLGTRRDHPPTPRCVCGKLSLPSEQAAKDVVFEARIARTLRHNPRRQEDRYYQCSFGAWHTTRQLRLTLTTAQDIRTNRTARRNVSTLTHSK
jgi:hypothetical protein